MCCRHWGLTEGRPRSLDKRFVDVNDYLVHQSGRIYETNKRIDRLYEVIARRGEYGKFENKASNLEQRVVEPGRKPDA